MSKSTNSPKVFVSYSRADTKDVLPLVDRLEEETGVHFWIDREGIESAAQFEEVIISAIDQAEVVLFMLSDNSQHSQWTKDEISYAKNTGKRVVPIVLHGGGLEGWFLFKFGRINYIDATQDEQVQRLAADIREWLHVRKEQAPHAERVNFTETIKVSDSPKKNNIGADASKQSATKKTSKQAKNDFVVKRSSKRHRSFFDEIISDIKLWFEYDFGDWLTSLAGFKFILIVLSLIVVAGLQSECPIMDNAYFSIVPIALTLCGLGVVIWGLCNDEGGWHLLPGLAVVIISGFISVMYIKFYWLERESIETDSVEVEEVVEVIETFGSFPVSESDSPYQWAVADMDVTGNVYDHDYVDLGLSVKWATMNIGASSPEQCGDYFAWGEISSKDTYTKENSKSHGNRKLNDIAGISSRDAARSNWGMVWRLPTRDEMEELASRCTWTWGKVGDLPGCKVTGPNGKSMFLPAAGYREKNVLNCNFGTVGYYWTSTACTADETSLDATTYACSIGFSKNWLYSEGDCRYCGLTIRPVCE